MPETPQDLNGDPSAARMSVVLATDSYQTIRPVIEQLGLQTVRNQLEIVIIGPAGVSQDSIIRTSRGSRLFASCSLPRSDRSVRRVQRESGQRAHR